MTATITALPTTIDCDFNIDASVNLTAAVKAAALAAALPSEGRPIISGVQIILEDNTLRFVATNSYVLHVVTITADTAPDAQGHWLVDAKQLVVAMPKRNEVVTLRFDEREVTVLNHSTRSSTVLPLIEGSFPNWQNLITTTTTPTTEPVGYSPKYLGVVCKAGEIFRTKLADGAPLCLRQGETELKPSHFEMNVVDRGTFFALLMPVRIS
jgi:hypothetical protein